MTFAPKAGHESDVEQFLRGGREIVEEEDGTLAWFALKFEDGRYGIFDVFPDTKSHYTEEFADPDFSAPGGVLSRDAGESGDQDAVEVEEGADLGPWWACLDFGNRAG